MPTKSTRLLTMGMKVVAVLFNFTIYIIVLRFPLAEAR